MTTTMASDSRVRFIMTDSLNSVADNVRGQIPPD
jgi:hypothetical protein